MPDMYDETEQELTNQQKAAILFITLGPENSAKVFQHMADDEIEKITLEIASQKQVTPRQKAAVLSEFYQMAMAKNYLSSGGLEYAQNVLEKALGSEKAASIINRLTTSLQVRPFDFLRKTDPAQLLNFIQNEHPQTIALIMAYLDPDQAATILSSLSQERQAEVAKRIAIMDRTSPEVIREVERVLERKLSSLVTQDFTTAGGVKAIVEVLNRVDRTTEKTIIETLEVDNPELTEEIKRLMFVFEDIVMLDDRSLQMVLREVDGKDLSLALKATPKEVASKVFKNMSTRAADMLKEEIEFMGPVKIRDVEEAQQKIVNVIRNLEDKGEIVVARGKGDEMIA
ncbi:flagellar motor switch protein FliG [Schwartzia succinivorans]|jgi:flagellar motor switch protein FliG|uniref:Flagellar motor switch protein FliG n=1 Tax=Schwartzia succinivorans DSM 10502 TaxID=1123243 RepID=A0A1M4TCE2_9FIRM|nr:flagellar motor switch protein FliG [Schwartzia succinivorans]MBQ1469533.1 flagellar motor switch protein FliG [Schwartzia sp. (in: firmicutes)]MBQ1918660.1 flagellar motor switch protein FliG [Schwartzia sp. (in: firmicutes)]MBQ3862613.1 flagellar motor switch protein FliG [Schwartzia sp. (in: firmicutes)]MBQ4152443.1 flagellar motor switch protein FliG [Schwartzia sp. (in: firmicutes)]MBQ5413762.1 flagellar motor switch protein FliG [Schwartzia sp. (in: firmicutes)]